MQVRNKGGRVGLDFLKLKEYFSFQLTPKTYRHTPYAGAATIEQGVVIDLSNLPSIGLAPDHKTITVSPSQTWDQVFATLDAFDLATLGGRVAGVGVGGLTTGCMYWTSTKPVSRLVL